MYVIYNLDIYFNYISHLDTVLLEEGNRLLFTTITDIKFRCASSNSLICLEIYEQVVLVKILQALPNFGTDCRV